MADEFDVTLKKKKKKSVAFSDDVLEAEDKQKDSKVEDADVEAMFSDLKKKKKKKKKSSEDGGEGGAEVEELDESMEELSLKKKKKKKNVVVEEEEGGEEDEKDAEQNDEEDNMEMDQDDDLKDTSDREDTQGLQSTDYEKMEKSWQDNDRDYTYRELLSRVFYIIRQNNPEFSGEKRKYLMIPPKVAKEGTKKTAFANIIDICNRMRRQPDHLTAYIFAELGTQGSMDGSQRLIIKGRYQPKQIENVLKHYIQEYVTCKTCRSPDTTLKKENKLFFLQCAACGSSRAVSAIKSGFQAQTAKRKTMRQ